MTRFLLDYLCDPEDGAPLTLEGAETDARGDIVSGTLRGPSGRTYPIVGGIPRFVRSASKLKAVQSFGEEWNALNFVDFKSQWLNHMVRNTFGSADAFRGRLVVDAGGGSGAQTLWMLEAGARHVILIDLSASVDDVVQRNLGPSGFRNVDVVQASIDAPPLRRGSIDGLVICHNVIQHTPSVRRTAKALHALVGGAGEFVFNVYPKHVDGLARKAKWFVYRFMRALIGALPFQLRMAYCRAMGVLRQLPLLGTLLEKAGLCLRGRAEAPSLAYAYRLTVLNTFDWFGSHAHQHHLSHEELKSLLRELQPEASRIGNFENYFATPPLPGCALRVPR